MRIVIRASAVEMEVCQRSFCCICATLWCGHSCTAFAPFGGGFSKRRRASRRRARHFPRECDLRPGAGQTGPQLAHADLQAEVVTLRSHIWVRLNVWGMSAGSGMADIGLMRHTSPMRELPRSCRLYTQKRSLMHPLMTYDPVHFLMRTFHRSTRRFIFVSLLTGLILLLCTSTGVAVTLSYGDIIQGLVMSLSASVESTDASTGVVVINGNDARQPLSPFDVGYGDGTMATGWFPFSHTYTSLTRNYVATITARYAVRTISTVEVPVRFTQPVLQPFTVDADVQVSVPAEVPAITSTMPGYPIPSVAAFSDSDLAAALAFHALSVGCGCSRAERPCPTVACPSAAAGRGTHRCADPACHAPPAVAARQHA